MKSDITRIRKTHMEYIKGQGSNLETFLRASRGQSESFQSNL